VVGAKQNTVFGCFSGERRESTVIEESTAFVLEWRCERERERSRQLPSWEANGGGHQLN
jgi:hypothetical protein